MLYALTIAGMTLVCYKVSESIVYRTIVFIKGFKESRDSREDM